MARYNYDSFSAKQYDLAHFRGPRVGQKVPDVTVTTLDGERRSLTPFDGEFLVLELGSLTCPLFQSRRGGMAKLVRAYPRAHFAVLYVREAHPGRTLPAHCDLQDKRARARHLRDEDGEGREVLVDDIEGTAHRAFGAYPNAVFIINRNGCVVYRSAWNNPRATGRALRRLLAGRPAQAEGAFVPPLPPVALRTLRHAGKGAGLDFLRSLPTLIWNNLIVRNLRLLFGRPHGVPPAARC